MSTEYKSYKKITDAIVALRIAMAYTSDSNVKLELDKIIKQLEMVEERQEIYYKTVKKY